MKSISVSDNLHTWIMDHKDCNKTSAEKVIYGLFSEVDCLEKQMVVKEKKKNKIG